MRVKLAPRTGAHNISAQSVSAWSNIRLAIWQTTGAKKAISSSVCGELYTELRDGRTFTLTEGMSYQVADDAEAHRSRSTIGATLFIVD